MILAGKLDAAEQLLNRARTLNPTELNLWGWSGLLAYKRGQHDEAIADYTKEIYLHSGNPALRQQLASLYELLDRDQDARKVFEEWISADSSNSEPVANLMEMLLRDGNPTDAVKTGNKAAETLPSAAWHNERLQYLFGKAQLQAGLPEQASRTLTALLKTTNDDSILNSGAHVLADAGRDLPLAEVSMRTAIEQISRKSQNWTLSEPYSLLQYTTLSIETRWDTLGWIALREGKLPEATTYLRAAWACKQSAEIAQHIEALDEKLGDRSASLPDRELALAAYQDFDQLGLHADPAKPPHLTRKETELADKVDAARKTGLPLPSMNSHQALVKMRTFALGPSDGLNGTARYLMLLSQGSVEKAQPVGESLLPTGQDLLRRANLSQLWPFGSKAKLVRLGDLNCHDGLCELVLTVY